MNHYNLITAALKKSAHPEKAEFHAQYFKTGGAGYGAGDKFLGVTVPDQRIIAKKFFESDFQTLEKLLNTTIHEYRLTALFILLIQYKKGDDLSRKKVFNFLQKHEGRINNWDLVDTVARDIFGHFVFTYFSKQERKKFFDEHITSENLWSQRIAVVATHFQIKQEQSSEYLFYVGKKLLSHKHDLIHKAMGWMLREFGKTSNDNEQELKNFLKEHYDKLPRTTLRYAIEKFEEGERKYFLSLK